MQTVSYKIWLDNITEVAGEEWLKKAQTELNGTSLRRSYISSISQFKFL